MTVYRKTVRNKTQHPLTVELIMRKGDSLTEDYTGTQTKTGLLQPGGEQVLDLPDANSKQMPYLNGLTVRDTSGNEETERTRQKSNATDKVLNENHTIEISQWPAFARGLNP